MSDETKENKPKHLIMPSCMRSDRKVTEAVTEYLRSKGFVCINYCKDLPGKPNITIGDYNTVIFIWNCISYMHLCKDFYWPKSNADHWRGVVHENVSRAFKETALLEEQGWNVITSYECQYSKKTFQIAVDTLISIMKSLPLRINGNKHSGGN